MAVKVMITDDHSLIREGLKQLLELEGDFQVIAEACDGIDCMEKLKEQIPDVLLLDINMPRMDGFTFIAQVREQDIYKDIPIIILSTEGEERDIQKGIQLGANLYMVKPAQPEKMVRNIKMLLG